MRYGHLVMSLFCAWVMWEQAVDYSTSSVRWAIIESFETSAPCERQAREVAKSFADKWGGKLHSEKPMVTESANQFTFKCIPDTVDPRAPKAGK